LTSSQTRGEDARLNDTPKTGPHEPEVSSDKSEGGGRGRQAGGWQFEQAIRNRGVPEKDRAHIKEAIPFLAHFPLGTQYCALVVLSSCR
ncbi:MAG: hypothetical protein M3R52_12170, partial [Acidobacteriota bacterium]|nr:hypothetical protein [Acidobacteriota bacterium]